MDTDECENGLVLINLRNEDTHPIMVDTCGERCAQLDDFSWMRPTEEWNVESDMRDSEMDTPHIGDGVYLTRLHQRRERRDSSCQEPQLCGRSDET